MLTKNLIKQLQKLVDEREPHISIMGEHQIMIDLYRPARDMWEYAGFTPKIKISRSHDGIYHILIGEEEERE